MIWSEAKRVTVGGLRLIETPGLVMGDRVGDGLLEWARHALKRNAFSLAHTLSF